MMTVATSNLPRNDLHVDLADDRWRQVVTQTAATMNAPPYNTPHEKLQKAMDLVLTNKVQADEDGLYTVQGSTTPYAVNGTCRCPQGQSGKSKWCKHLVAVELWKRVQLRLSDAGHRDTNRHRHNAPNSPLMNESEDLALDAQRQAQPCAPAGLPEAPASANCFVEIAGRRVQVTLRDTNEEQLLSRMEKLLARFPAEEQETTTPRDPSYCTEHQQQCLRRGEVWVHANGEHNGKTKWCRRKVQT